VFINGTALSMLGIIGSSAYQRQGLDNLFVPASLAAKLWGRTQTTDQPSVGVHRRGTPGGGPGRR
jgi:hypothetical protein